jgi:hypothetical protein
VHANRNEGLLDELYDSRIRVHLGIQPSAAASHRRGAEIEQHLAAGRGCIAQRGIEVVSPGDLTGCRRHCSSFPDIPV